MIPIPKARPFLKRGSGLLRFYKNGNVPESPAPLSPAAPTPTVTRRTRAGPAGNVKGRNLQQQNEVTNAKGVALPPPPQASTGVDFDIDQLPTIRNRRKTKTSPNQSDSDSEPHNLSSSRDETPLPLPKKIPQNVEENDEEDAEEIEDEYSEWESLDEENCEEGNEEEEFNNEEENKELNYTEDIDFEPSSPIPAPISIDTENQIDIQIQKPESPCPPVDLNTSLIDQELRLFELMENFTSKLSFCSTSSTVQKFVHNKVNGLLSSPNRYQRTKELKSILKPSSPGPGAAATSPVPHPNSKVNFAHVEHEQDEDEEPRPLGPAAADLEEENEDPISPDVLRRVMDLIRQETEYDYKYNSLLQLQDEVDGNEAKNLDPHPGSGSSEAEELNVLRQTLTRLQKDLTFRTSNFKSTERQLKNTITSLQSQVAELEKDIKVRTSRWACSSRAMREQIQKLKKENDELKLQNEKIRKMSLEKEIREARLRSNRILQLEQQQLKQAQNSVPVSTTATMKKLKNAGNGNVSAGDGSQSDESNKENAIIKSQNIVTNGKPQKIVTYASGTQRIFDKDGNCLKILYSNGDLKDLSLLGSGIVKYYFKSANLWQTTHTDGKEVLEFPSGEIQTQFPDGYQEILYPDKTLRKLYPDGTIETIFPDKTVVRNTEKDPKTQTVTLPNGQVEVRGDDYTCRIYPDGTQKILYTNGSTLTRYSSGRQRFKDANGTLIYDHKN